MVSAITATMNLHLNSQFYQHSWREDQKTAAFEWRQEERGEVEQELLMLALPPRSICNYNLQIECYTSMSFLFSMP